MSHDELKNLFDSAFQNEHIPFDPNSWTQMEKMLVRSKRRRMLWLWFSGLGVTTVAIVAIALFTPHSAKIYAPRQSMALQSPLNSRNVITEINRAINATTSGDGTVAKTANVADQMHSSISTKHSDHATQSAFTASDYAKMDGQATFGKGASHTHTIDVFAQPNIEEANKSQIPPMPALTQPEVIASNHIQNVIIADTFYEKNLPRLYMRVGITRVFDPQPFKPSTWRFGQVAGIGADYKLANHLLFSAELNVAFDAVNYSRQQNEVHFGYEPTLQRHEVNMQRTTMVELPIFLRYRTNKLSAGFGLNVAYLASVNVLEKTQTTGTEGAPNVLETEYRFVRWNDIPTIHFGLSFDAQYQLNETFSIGTRYTYGLRDFWPDDAAFNRKNRLELYLKLPLK